MVRADRLFLIGRGDGNVVCLETEVADKLAKGDVILGIVMMSPENFEFFKNLQPNDYKQLMILFQCAVAEVRK